MNNAPVPAHYFVASRLVSPTGGVAYKPMTITDPEAWVAETWMVELVKEHPTATLVIVRRSTPIEEI